MTTYDRYGEADLGRSLPQDLRVTIVFLQVGPILVMGNQLNSNGSTIGEIELSQDAVDALIQRVSEAMDTLTFDAHDQGTLRQLVAGFADTRGMVRLRIAETLGEMGEAVTPVVLEGLREHPNPVVRRACAKTMTIIADPEAVPTLVEAFLHDEDTVVHGSSVGALARIGEPAVPDLLRVLENPEYPEVTKGHAAWALAFMGAEAEPHLMQVLASDSSEVRAAVIGALAKILQENPDADSANILIKALEDPVEDVRCEAAAAIGNLAYQPALPNLLTLLKHPSAESRRSAALALMKVGDLAAMEPLQTALAHESEEPVQQVIKLAITLLERQSDD
ncbi:MAG: HEAT repeat domain-containing protein [Leptolyngbyaceae cyanobacterium]